MPPFSTVIYDAIEHAAASTGVTTSDTATATTSDITVKQESLPLLFETKLSNQAMLAFVASPCLRTAFTPFGVPY